MAIRFRNETKNELKGYRRPRHAQSPKDVCFSTLCTANNVLGCLPKGWPPSSRSPTTMLSIWVGRDTTLCFPCISRAEPQSKAWVLNGLSALGMWSWGPRRKPPLVKAAVVLHSRCLYQRVVPSTERTWTLAESPRAWRWDRTWPFTKKSLVSWEDSAFTGGAEFDLTASENQRHVSSGTSKTVGAVLAPLGSRAHCRCRADLHTCEEDVWTCHMHEKQSETFQNLQKVSIPEMSKGLGRALFFLARFIHPP